MDESNQTTLNNNIKIFVIVGGSVLVVSHPGVGEVRRLHSDTARRDVGASSLGVAVLLWRATLSRLYKGRAGNNVSLVLVAFPNTSKHRVLLKS